MFTFAVSSFSGTVTDLIRAKSEMNSVAPSKLNSSESWQLGFCRDKSKCFGLIFL